MPQKPIVLTKTKARPARLSDIRLSERTAFFENRARTLEYLKMLDCDRMLYNFRAAFSLEPSCEPLGGWEEKTGLLRGHSTGHFLSALAIAYSATGEETYKEKMDYMVSSLRALQKMCKGSAHEFETLCTPDDAGQEKWSRDVSTWGEGFISAYSPDQFALLEKLTPYNKIWAPYYTLHKLLAGFLECWSRADNDEALLCAEGIGDWVYDRLSHLSPEHRKKMWSLYIAGEFGGMNESLSILYRATGNEKYIECAKMFDNENIFPALGKGIDAIQNLHANQHIPQILGALDEYLSTGDGFYLSVGQSFFDIVTNDHMYSIGGVGQGESFRAARELAKNIKDATNCETCAAYNLLKTSRALFSLFPSEAKYMEYYERAMINQILASQSPFVTPTRHNGVTYMLPIGPGAEKEYSDDYLSFTCCHGTGMENHLKYPDASFFEMPDGTVTVAQYVPAKYVGKVKISIDIPFPAPKGTIKVEGDTDCEILFRIPTWTKNPFTLSGEQLPEKGSFARLSHKGGETETVSVSFDYSVRFEETPDELDGTKLVSVLYGPFVMVAENAAKEYLPLPKDIRPASGEVKLSGGDMTFIPMYQMHGKPYHTYFKKN